MNNSRNLSKYPKGGYVLVHETFSFNDEKERHVGEMNGSIWPYEPLGINPVGLSEIDGNKDFSCSLCRDGLNTCFRGFNCPQCGVSVP